MRICAATWSTSAGTAAEHCSNVIAKDGNIAWLRYGNAGAARWWRRAGPARLPSSHLDMLQAIENEIVLKLPQRARAA